MKLSAKFKKVLSGGFRATLILCFFFKVALNPPDRLTLQNVSSCPSDYFSEIKIGGHLVHF